MGMIWPECAERTREPPAIRRAVVGVGVLVALLLAPSIASAGGGALDRFQSAHTPPSNSSSSSSSSSNNNTDDSRSSTSSDTSSSSISSDSSSSSSSSSNGNLGLAFVAIGCLIPPFPFACLMPSHRVSAAPYAPEGLYIEPKAESGEVELEDSSAPKDLVYLDSDLDRARVAELSVTGFRSLNEDVFSHELKATFWMRMVLFRASWEHLYERIETTGGFDHLDIGRAHFGANMLGPFVNGAELYMMVGGLFLSGNGLLIPAFDIGGELRVYPARPLALYAGMMGSVFELGPALIDSRFEAGIAIGEAEVRAGARFLTQDGAQGFWGPSVTLIGRF